MKRKFVVESAANRESGAAFGPSKETAEYLTHAQLKALEGEYLRQFDRGAGIESALRDLLDTLRNPIGGALAACLNRAWDALALPTPPTTKDKTEHAITAEGSSSTESGAVPGEEKR